MPDRDGRTSYQWTLTSPTLSDVVKLVAGPYDMLPVVFVPGIMGSNLRDKQTGKAVWRLDATMGQPIGLARRMAFKDAGDRQSILHPARCEVDPDGDVPSLPSYYHRGTVQSTAVYAERGWGTVAEASYHAFLLWLEDHLNPPTRNPALWSDYFQDETTVSATPAPNAAPKLFPGVRMGIKGSQLNKDGRTHSFVVNSDDLLKHSKFWMPVYAAGYNWLDSNDAAAEKLRERIREIVAANNHGSYRCTQVILVTHSMGGMVARACAALPGMADMIAGVVHGVMPAVGAAVAYRRCKLGMSEEGAIAGLVLGSTGREVTAVFAQAPGALQLLPSQAYRKNWLNIVDGAKAVLKSLPTDSDPFTDIYKVRDRWWGLVDESWLTPRGGTPIGWDEFTKNIDKAQDFHTQIADAYHPTTYVFYGSDDSRKTSFESITWHITAGLAPDSKPRPLLRSVLDMSYRQVRMFGTNPGYVGGETKVHADQGAAAVYDTSYWELRCGMQDGPGDGTVPKSSGAAPSRDGGARVIEQFQISGVEHEPAYKNAAVHVTTLYAITRIIGTARLAK